MILADDVVAVVCACTAVGYGCGGGKWTVGAVDVVVVHQCFGSPSHINPSP